MLAGTASHPDHRNPHRATWRSLRHELDRMHLVTLATADGRVAQRYALTSGHKTILAALDLPEPGQLPRLHTL